MPEQPFLSRRQVIEEAKQMVIYHGPSLVLDSGQSIIQDFGVIHRYGDENANLILNEACRQARRVIAFLGYEP